MVGMGAVRLQVSGCRFESLRVWKSVKQSIFVIQKSAIHYCLMVQKSV